MKGLRTVVQGEFDAAPRRFLRWRGDVAEPDAVGDGLPRFREVPVLRVGQESLQGAPVRFSIAEPQTLRKNGLANPVSAVSLRWQP